MGFSGFGNNYTKPTIGAQINWGHPDAQGLIFCAPMWENSGTYTYDVANFQAPGLLTAFGGTAIKAVWDSQGRAGGRSIKFARSGASDGSYVRFPFIQKYKITNKITVVSWVNFTSNPGAGNNHGIVRRLNNPTYTNGWSLQGSGADMVFQLYISGAYHNTTATGVITFSGWHQYVGVYDGINIKVYVDGVEKSSTAQAGDITEDASSPINLGADGSFDPTNAYMDSVNVYNTAMPAAQIKELYINPYGFFTKNTYRRYFVPASAGGSVFSPYYYLENIARMA